MAAMQQMTPAMSQAATGYMQNPFGNPFFQQQQQMGMGQARQLGGAQMQNVQGNMAASGIGQGGAAPFQQEMMQNQARANSGLQAQLGFMNPTNNALSMQQNAMGLAAGYRPLQTGATTNQTTSGLGSWLPQVASAGMNAISPLQSLFSGGGGGQNVSSNPMSSGGFAGTNTPGFWNMNQGSMPSGMMGQGGGNYMNQQNPFFGGGMQQPQNPAMGGQYY